MYLLFEKMISAFALKAIAAALSKYQSVPRKVKGARNESERSAAIRQGSQVKPVEASSKQGQAISFDWAPKSSHPKQAETEMTPRAGGSSQPEQGNVRARLVVQAVHASTSRKPPSTISLLMHFEYLR